jgi:hypothetical protein
MKQRKKKKLPKVYEITKKELSAYKIKFGELGIRQTYIVIGIWKFCRKLLLRHKPIVKKPIIILSRSRVVRGASDRRVLLGRSSEMRVLQGRSSS